MITTCLPPSFSMISPTFPHSPLFLWDFWCLLCYQVPASMTCFRIYHLVFTLVDSTGMALLSLISGCRQKLQIRTPHPKCHREYLGVCEICFPWNGSFLPPARLNCEFKDGFGLGSVICLAMESKGALGTFRKIQVEKWTRGKEGRREGGR